MAGIGSKTPPILALTFDLDDTLWDVWPTIERAEVLLHDWLSERYPKITARYDPVALRGLRARLRQSNPAHPYAHDLTRLRIEGLRLAARNVGYNAAEFDAEAAFAVFHAARNDVQFFADALPALENLARHYTLGALSNGNADIRLVGLDHLFDFALSAADVGSPKPDPAIFQAALKALGNLDPRQIVHVGDDPHTDIWGAARAGWRTVWVNRRNQPWEHPHQADAEIRELGELEGLLGTWQA